MMNNSEESEADFFRRQFARVESNTAMSEEEIKQAFENNSDCYSTSYDYNGSALDVPAMSKEKFVEVVKGLLTPAPVSVKTVEDERELAKIMGIDNPWPLHDVLKRLSDAAEYLLNKKDYDGPDYEEIQTSSKRAKEIMQALSSFSPVAVYQPSAEDVKRWFQILVGISEDAMVQDFKKSTNPSLPPAPVSVKTVEDETAIRFVKGFINAYDRLNYNINPDFIDRARKYLSCLPPAPVKPVGDGMKVIGEWQYDFKNQTERYISHLEENVKPVEGENFALKALSELVRLKRIKNYSGETEDYLKSKDAAWESAFEVVDTLCK